MAQTTTHRELRAPAASYAPATSAAGRRPAGWRKALHAAPTLFVLVMLAAVAYWGHQTDWTLPKFSTLIGRGDEPSEAWCQEHNVAESQCIECQPDLTTPDKDYGWCKEHGVAQCPLHHPDVAQLKDVPSVIPADLDQASRALGLRPRPENNSRCKLHLRRIQFASQAAVDKVGVDIDVAHQRPVVEAAVANGEIVYDQTRMAHLASRVSGTAWRVLKQVGDRVKRGEVLALIDAAEVGRAKAEFLQAVAHLRHETATVEKLKPLSSGRLVTGREFRAAEAALEDAQIALEGAEQALINLGLTIRADDLADIGLDEIGEQLRLLGLPDAIAEQLEPKASTSNLFPIRSPIAGEVVERDLVAGEVVDTSSPLFSIADLDQMWLMLDVRQDDAQYLSLGQQVLFRPSDAGRETDVAGTLSWISTAIDDRTRTLKVRVDLPNPEGRLRANTFGTGRIVLRQEPRAVVVPDEAVHSDGCCQVVFVRDKDFLKPDAPKFFHVRKVRTGVKDAGNTEIIVGLLPGEIVAAKNSVVLEAQLLKGNLGAGCGCAGD
ncbi:MAG TPA: efflux RND transporter periplasmic adaptor subunit [Pirellulales bacterium]|nr:efflux RND transporter periplasmic adaptor subunit [Pirellulales bacterium]